MKLKITIGTIIMFLAAFSLAFAAGNRLEGEVNLQLNSINFDGNKATYQEYQDLRTGVTGDVRLRYNSAGYFLNFDGADIGRTNQSYLLDGGRWGKFSYFLGYDQLKHNFTYDARTFYTGVGTGLLNYTGTVPPGGAAASGYAPTSTTVFDYANERKKLLAGFSLDLAKPFYFNVAVSREKKAGVKAAAAGALTGGGFGLELPEPLDYQTDVLKLDAGYATKDLFVGASFFASEFRNEIERLYHRNATYAQSALAPANRFDVYTMPPDNSYYKLSLKGAVALPWSSRLSANYGFSSTKSETELLNYITSSAAPGWEAITLSKPAFSGKLESQNLDLVLTSSPIAALDAKVFYKLYRKSNKSDAIATTQGATTFTNHLFDYDKDSMGASLGIKLPANLKLTPAYSYQTVNRNRGDFPKTSDETFSADLKWTGHDVLTANLGYERLNRTGDWRQIILVTGTQATSNALEPYIRRFDVAPLNRDSFKAGFELYPLADLSLGFNYRNIRTNFKDTVFGIREDKSDEVNVDLSYSMGATLKLSAYYDWERTKSFQFQRRANAAGVTPAQANPAAAPTATYYNWDVDQTFVTDGYGFGADVVVIPKKLTLALRYDSVKSDGLADFNIQWLTGTMTNDNVDVNNWEDYRKQSFLAKAVYSMSKTLDLTLGYVFEKFDYSDALYDGYSYLATTTAGLINNYLTGAYSNPQFHTHRVFAGATWRF